ncbi:MAG: hypothetical protein IPM77_12800 [Crocinitomicaceae bacterium]|nr:hypothetical protein [Crocinitomicaceae bacterium]
MTNQNLFNFRKLISDKKSDYLDIEIDKEAKLLSAHVIFQVLDFIGDPSNKMTTEIFADLIGLSSAELNLYFHGKKDVSQILGDKMLKVIEEK